MTEIKNPSHDEFTPPDGSSQDADEYPDNPAKFSLKGYLLLNLVVWLFCICQIAMLMLRSRGPQREPRLEGILFFFVAIGVVFSLVSIFDFAYDRLFPQTKPETQPAKND